MNATKHPTTIYIERDCVFEHDGRKFEAGGAVVTPYEIAAYPAKNGVLNDWHGQLLGTWRATSSWPVRSYIGSRMYQIEATVNGVVYTGRGFGDGMFFRGRRKAGRAQPRNSLDATMSRLLKRSAATFAIAYMRQTTRRSCRISAKCSGSIIQGSSRARLSWPATLETHSHILSWPRTLTRAR